MKISKTRILFLVFIIGNSFSTMSQIYISDYFDGDIFVGPENVMFVNGQIKEYYVADFKYEINNMKSKLSLIDSLDNIQNISREDKRKLKTLKIEKPRLESEIVFLEHLLLKWEEIEIIEIDVEKKYCLFDTVNKINKRVEVSLSEMKSYSICEFIESEFKLPTTKWEKKKANENCLSANPDDCLVWYLVEVGGHEIYDFAGKVLNFELENPTYFNFEFNSNASKFYRFVELESNYSEEIYTISEQGTNIKVPYSKINLCDEK